MLICFSFARARIAHARFVLDFSIHSALAAAGRTSRCELRVDAKPLSGMHEPGARAIVD